jgi:hypothetical protein
MNPTLDRGGHTGETGAVTGFETMESRPGWGVAIPPLLRNDNWNYGRFDKTGTPVANQPAPCLACHKSKAADSYMFSHAELVGRRGRVGGRCCV